MPKIDLWKKAHELEIAANYNKALDYLGALRQEYPKISALVDADISRVYRALLKSRSNKNSDEIKKFEAKMDFIRSTSTDSGLSVSSSKSELHEKKDNDILLEIFKISQISGYPAAFSHAKKITSIEDFPAINLIKANEKIDNDKLWLQSVNGYLESLGASPISLLKKAGSKFSRITAVAEDIVDDGPLISVIMPAYNCEDTIELAANSILNQSWRNLELIIINDCSTDKTLQKCLLIESKDSRVKVISNKENVGPYVSKNMALKLSKGEYVTGHDSDDWAHPDRLKKQVEAMMVYDLDASLAKMVRITDDGKFSHITKTGALTDDGAFRVAFISCMLKRQFLVEKIGFWDSVRFGGDSEIIARVKILAQDKFKTLEIFSMLCLESPNGLTNHPVHGKTEDGSLSPARKEYVKNWREWHKNAEAESLYMPFPCDGLFYSRPDSMRVPLTSVEVNIEEINSNLEKKNILCIFHDPFMKNVFEKSICNFDFDFFASDFWPARPNSTSRLNLANYEAVNSLSDIFNVKNVYKESFDADVCSRIESVDFVVIHQTASKKSLDFVKDFIDFYKNKDRKFKIIFGTEHTWSKSFNDGSINEEELKFIYCENLLLRHTPKTDVNSYSLFNPQEMRIREFELGLVPDLFSFDSSQKDDRIIFVKGPEGRVTKNNELIDDVIVALKNSQFLANFEIDIITPPYSSSEYWEKASKAKFLVFTSNSETFSYVLNDARALGVISFHPLHMYCTNFGFGVVENYVESPHKFFSIQNLIQQMEEIATSDIETNKHIKYSIDFAKKMFSLSTLSSNWRSLLLNDFRHKKLFVYDKNSQLKSTDAAIEFAEKNGYEYVICCKNSMSLSIEPLFSKFDPERQVAHLSYFLTEKEGEIFRSTSLGPLNGVINNCGEQVVSENFDEVLKFFLLITRLYKITHVEFDESFTDPLALRAIDKVNSLLKGNDVIVQ